MFVSNSSTLILLARISILRLFLDNAPTIIVPKEVENEMTKKNTFDALLIQQEIVKNRIIVEKEMCRIKNKVVEQFHLDKGEAAAYCLFDRKKHATLLTDDGELIKLCKIENIPFMCAMAILIRLFDKNKLSRNECLEKLDKLTKIGRYSQTIYEKYKQEVR